MTSDPAGAVPATGRVFTGDTARVAAGISTNFEDKI
jgi:hypothetical protein